MSNLEERFINRLKQLAEGQDRGALASLRRGLGQPPGTVADMYRYVEPFLGGEARYKEDAFYLVAALFALHPKSTDEKSNMGTHLAKTRTDAGADALERRFTALLAAHPDDLPDYLRQAVSFLKSKEEPVNWLRLLQDLQYWDKRDDPKHSVQRRWAQEFWRKHQSTESTDNSNNQGE